MGEVDALSVEFPATKQELVEAAVDADLNQETVEGLQALSHEQYGNRTDVERELDYGRRRDGLAGS